MTFSQKKTRFAPSPTGMMHIGNLRAAVLSYLWSLKNGAEFILRIDDTDRERSKEELKEYIKQDLTWLGISWDYTFKQSDRSHLYREVMAKCIASRLVYEVYETEDEIEQIRKDLSRKKLPPAYKRFENRRRGTEEEKYWRFDLGKSIIQFEDKIRGKIEIDLSSTSDPVICKANGDFTYIFASVVDDLDCKISTIIRASDHISNTATQLLIIRKMLEHKIFVVSEPEFGHYPLFVHESKEKLSKRNKSMSIDELKSIHPLAICHFLYAIGNNQKVQAHNSLDKLAESFRFEDYSKSNIVEFSEKHLLHWQKKVISVLDSSEIDAWTGISLGDKWNVVRDCIENQEDIFYWKKVLEEKRAFCVFSQGKDLLKESLIDCKEKILKILEETKNQKKLSEEFKLKFLSIRQALTGKNFGPKLDELVKVIPDELIDLRLANYKNVAFKVNNSVSGEQEIFRAMDPFKVKMYACGPTLYGPPHIGNARSFVVFDLLYRLLKFEYKQVVYARNITDIDDKIINKAQEMKLSINELVDQIYPQFKQQMKELNVLEPNFEPRVTQFLPQIISCIERMLQNGCAYQKDDGIYFKIATVDDYNLFRICGESEADFVLWKFRQRDEVGWESPWGWGRPGWHIECTAMSEATLGLPFDLHLGGMDLKFPHHTNECAQACGMGFLKTANYWLHSNFINVDKLKMSKSLNNFVTLADLEHHPMIIRTAFLSSHYRQQLSWSEELLQEATTIYNKWRRCIGKAILRGSNLAGYPLVEVLEALNLDLNTPLALKKLDAAISESSAGDLLASFDLLGIQFNFGYLNDRSIKALVDKRQKARSEGNFQLADQLREQLVAVGVELEEGKGVSWYQKIK